MRTVTSFVAIALVGGAFFGWSANAGEMIPISDGNKNILIGEWDGKWNGTDTQGGIYWRDNGPFHLSIDDSYKVRASWTTKQGAKSGEGDVEIDDGKAVINFGTGDRSYTLQKDDDGTYRINSKFNMRSSGGYQLNFTHDLSKE